MTINEMVEKLEAQTRAHGYKIVGFDKDRRGMWLLQAVNLLDPAFILVRGINKKQMLARAIYEFDNLPKRV